MIGGRQQAAEFSTRITKQVTTQYLVYLPREHGRRRQKWPLVLFLHGMGERGTNVELVKRHGPPKRVEEGEQFPFILVSPQCPEDEYWSAEVLEALLNEIERRYDIDRTRVYVTGLSMGGYGTWKLAIRCPDRFAAVAPICGWGDASTVCALKEVPVWTFHGKMDKVVPIEKSEALVNALKQCGGNVRFTVYPEAGHDSWTETYENPALYGWLLEHELHRR